MNLKQSIFVTVFSVTALTASAAEIAINPGLWETTMTRTDPLSGQPVTETKTECVKEDKFDPAGMMQGTEGCDLVDDSLDGDTLTYHMECKIEGGKSIIDGQFQTDGQTGKGKMEISISAQGMNMKMNMDWVGKRVGDC